MSDYLAVALMQLTLKGPWFLSGFLFGRGSWGWGIAVLVIAAAVQLGWFWVAASASGAALEVPDNVNPDGL